MVRTFIVPDNAMSGIQQGEHVIAQHVRPTEWQDIEDFKLYVIVKDCGTTIRRLCRKDHQFVVIADNGEAQYLISKSVIKELYQVITVLNEPYDIPEHVLSGQRCDVISKNY